MSRLSSRQDKLPNPHRLQDQFTQNRDLGVQIVLSVGLGLSAFLAFCVRNPDAVRI